MSFAARYLPTVGVAAVILATGCAGIDQRPMRRAYVGSKSCAECHTNQYQAWQNSAHAWAMKRSSPEIAHGSFAGAVAVYGREARALFTKNERNDLTVTIREHGLAEGPYRVAYFFGNRTLEQHVVEFPRGRLQALPVGFDLARRQWFDIFADTPRQPKDWGHWSNRGMTANSECISCHTTGFDKGYDASTDGYATKWAEAGVGCEACHGPGSDHVAQARNATDQARSAIDTTLIDGHFSLQTCAACHGLQRTVWPGFAAGKALLDYFDPVLLDETDYDAGGGLVEEAYEWGSYTQSAMYGEGVTCLDCHEIHSATLVEAGDTLCTRCHDSRLAEPQHTHHKVGSAGSFCVECHMPERVFMARDHRRDHSFPIPDPTATAELGVANVCGQCHKRQDAAWLADKLTHWFGADAPERDAKRQRTRAVLAARIGNTQGLSTLLDCLSECEAAIWRATVAKLLGRFGRRADVRKGLLAAAGEPDDLVRAAVVWALGRPGINDPDVEAVLVGASDDGSRLVRINAAWGLRNIDLQHVDRLKRRAVEEAFREWQASQIQQADHAEAHHALGIFFEARGEDDMALAAYNDSLRLAPDAVPPRYNRAMLLARLGRTEEAMDDLRRIKTSEPRLPEVPFALGLLYGEEGMWRAAVTELTECLKIEPYYPRALHNLAHAYLALGDGQTGRAILETALAQPRTRREALETLVSINLEMADTEAARRWARVAAAEIPGFADHDEVRALLRE